MVSRLKLLAALALVACTAMSCERVVYVSDGCLWAEPIRPTKAEVAALTAQTVRQILAHNEKGAAVCGWKP